MSKRINYNSGIFQSPHTYTTWKFLVLLMVSFQLALTSNSLESDSHFFYRNTSNTSEESLDPILDDYKEIQSDVYERAAKVTSFAEFERLFDENAAINSQLDPKGDPSEERSNVIIAQNIKCDPIDTVVPLIRKNARKTEFQNVCCVLVKRCPICNIHGRQCVPTNHTTANYEVYIVDRKTRYRFKSLVPVEIHSDCELRCIIQEHHCKPFEAYDKHTCSCTCKPTGSYKNIEIQKFDCEYGSNGRKKWDTDNCSCKCNNECTTGLFLNERTCECEKEPSDDEPDGISAVETSDSPIYTT